MNINREITYNTQCNLNALNVSLINEMTQNLKDIKAKLSSKYHEFLNVFDQVQSDKLFSHRFYDHKIKLINDSTSFCCRVYWMFSVKLLKVKKYLKKNLSKKFITFSQTLYFFLVLLLWTCLNRSEFISNSNQFTISLSELIANWLKQVMTLCLVWI